MRSFLRSLVLFFCVALIGVKVSADEPLAPWVEEGKQVFLAQAQLEAYLSSLSLKSVSEKMGLDDFLVSHYDDGFFTTFLKSLRLVTFNTFNTGRLLFTDEEKILLKEWAFQRRSLGYAVNGLKVLYDVMGEREVGLQQAYQIISREAKYSEVRPWVQTVIASPWSQGVLTHTLPLRPALPTDFGLKFQIDFLDVDWKALLAEQINIANIYIFWRGPALIAALGSTKLGLAISQTLHLNKLIAATKALPTVLRGPALWLIYETADGCTIRYFYTAYVGLHQVNRPGVIRATGKIPTLPKPLIVEPPL